MADGASSVAVLTGESFDDAVAEGIVLVDFWAKWCGPCHALSPVLEELARETGGTRVAKVDAADFPGLARRFDVSSLPTIIVFKDGMPVKRLFGAKTKRQLARAVQSVSSAAS